MKKKTILYLLKIKKDLKNGFINCNNIYIYMEGKLLPFIKEIFNEPFGIKYL